MSLAVVLRDPMEIAFGIPPLLRVVLTIGLVGTALTVLGAVFAVRAWVRGAGSVAGRIHYSLDAGHDVGLVVRGRRITAQ